MSRQIINNRKFDLKEFIFRTVMILLGGFVTAAAINIFLVPFNLLSAGVTGIAMLLHYLAPVMSIGLYMLVLNIPIFILGWIYIDRRFTFWSLFGMAVLASSLELTKSWALWMVVDDLYMALIIGGLIAGVGMGMTFRARGSMGGTDIIAAILRKKFSTSIGSAQFGMNATILIALAYKFSFQSALASGFSIFFEAWACDKTILGISTNKALLVVTNRPQKVGEALMKRLDRGVTYLLGRGGYLKNEKELVYCVITPRQLAQAKAVVEQIDPESFSTVMDANEVIGDGFKSSPI